MHTTDTAITLGKVSARKGARNHLDVTGRAHCGAGRGIIADATRTTANGDLNIAGVCRRCLKALRATVAAVVDHFDATTTDDDPAYIPMCDDERAARNLRDLLATPAERAAREQQLAADILAAARTAREERDNAPTYAQTLGLNPADYQRRLLDALNGGPAMPGFEMWAPAETAAALTYGFTAPAAA